MFGGNNKNEASKTKSSSSSPATHSLNSLVQGTVVEGTVTSENDIRIDGTIKGKLYCQSKVIIGPTGTVEGEIRCQNAVIEGNFQGSIEVKELLNIKDKAKISGEVSTNKLIVQSGAVFDVTCTMGGQLNKSAGSEGRRSGTSTNQKQDVAKGAKA
jgi:cytoskeletal protein CcmA (bactofilin family)